MILPEQLLKINYKFNCPTCISVFQLGESQDQWRLIVKLQNSMGQFECLTYLNILSSILNGKSHSYATLDDRMNALYKFSIL